MKDVRELETKKLHEKLSEARAKLVKVRFAVANKEAKNVRELRKLREDISRGRAPTKVGPKLITGKGHIKMTTRKSNKLNKIIAQRSHIKSNRAQIPNIENNKINFTKQRKDIKSQNIANRLDTYMVDAFKKNPYTQSLNSFC